MCNLTLHAIRVQHKIKSCKWELFGRREMDYPIGPPMGQGYLAMWKFALSVNSPTVKTCMESCRVCEANFSLGLSQSQQLTA